MLARITTTGESAASERERSPSGGAPVCSKSTPGTCARIFCDGEKPSLRFHSAGSIGTPCLFTGMESIDILTRQPVSVLSSSTTKALLGQGNMQLT